jgi:two-component system, OmpR family, sensor kinase
MNWPRSLRARLTAAFVALAGTAVLVAAFATSVLLERAIWDPLDAEMREEAETVCSLLGAGAIDDVREAVETLAREQELGPGKFIRVSDADGRVLAGAGYIPPGVERVPRSDADAWTTRVPGHHRRYRVAWLAKNPGCHVLLGAGASRHARLLRSGRAAIAASATALVMVLGFVAWVVTGRATTELGRLAEEIQSIEAGALERRLVPRQTLEVEQLVTVLNRLLARLETTMTHLQRFTADAAHELRTPIAGLRARLEAALDGARTTDAYANGLLDALEQTERLGRLAEHLLTLAAVEAGGAGRTFGPVRLDAVAHEVTESLEPVAQEQGRRFECVAPAPVTVRGDAHLLKRVLVNLVDNALRHTPPGSAVRVAVRQNGAGAVLEVRDEGPGIAAGALPRIFDRFHRGAGNGSGLGLALCREIVALHRGTIAVDSDGSRGTTVTVQLPT